MEDFMKKLFLIVFLLLVVFSFSVQAGPFLTCDCSVAEQNITGAKLKFGTSDYLNVPVVTTCGSNPATQVTCAGTSRTICYDLAVLPSGPFTVVGRFVNDWGESADSVPFSDTKVLPGNMSGTRIVQ